MHALVMHSTGLWFRVRFAANSVAPQVRLCQILQTTSIKNSPHLWLDSQPAYIDIFACIQLARYAIFTARKRRFPQTRNMLDDYFRQYGYIAIFTAVAVAVPVGMLLMSWALSLFNVRPRMPSAIKESIYECGFETLTGRWSQFNFRFYGFALLFVIFDVEVIFLFPWAASYGFLSRHFGVFILLEMLVFIAILLVGWLYAWRKGSLEWS